MKKLLKNEIFQRSFSGFGLLLWINMNLRDLAERPNDISSAFLLPNNVVFWFVTFVILAHIVFNKFITWLFCFIVFNILIIIVTITKLIPSLDMYMPGKHPMDAGLYFSLIIIYGLVGGIDYLIWKIKPVTL